VAAQRAGWAAAHVSICIGDWCRQTFRTCIATNVLAQQNTAASGCKLLPVAAIHMQIVGAGMLWE
jgi:hypothetical protein